MKKVFVILTAALLLLTASCGKKTASTVSGNAIRHAEITVKGYGTIKLELDAEAAPITVAT